MGGAAPALPFGERRELAVRRCLIVVDYQVDFVTGALGFPGAEKLAERIARKIRAYREAGDDVLFTLDTHGEDYLETFEGTRLPVPHCIEGTRGHELFGAVGEERAAGDRVFCKGGFGSDALYAYLRETPYRSIELVGVVTNICVLSNAVLAKTAQPETEILVDANCVGSNDPALGRAALDVLESLQVQVLR